MRASLSIAWPLRLVYLLSCICFGALHQSRCDAQLPTASLRGVWPCAIQAGSSVEAIVEGDFLDEADELYFSDPRIKANVNLGETLLGNSEPSKRYGHFTLEIPSDIPAGSFDVWVGGRYGLSNPRRLIVETVPVTVVEGDRSSFEMAHEIHSKSVTLRRATEGQVDHYRMQLESGTSIQIGCDALAIDSLFVPTLILCDSNNKELKRVRGTKLADASLSFEIDSTGTYFLKVHDVLFRGGSTYFYRLQLDSEWNTESKERLTPTRVAEQPTMEAKEYLTSTEKLRRLDELDLGAASSISLTPPEMVQSNFPRSGLPSASFDFDAKAGERWWIEVISAGIGSATDPDMQIGRLRPQADGAFQFERLHHIDDVTTLPGSLLGSIHKDPAHLLQVPEDGRYRVILRDLQTTSDRGWDKSFLFSIGPANPDFTLLAMVPHATLDPARSSPMGTLLRRGEKRAVEVAILTEGGFFQPVTASASLAGGELQLKQTINWNWPVTVTAEGLPAGITCTAVNLSHAQRRGHLIFEASDDVETWAGPVRIFGTVTIPEELGGQVLRREAKPVTVQFSDPDGRGRAVVRACDEIRLATTDLETTPVKVSLGGETSEFSVPLGTELEIPLNLVRSEGATAKVTLRAIGLPPNSNAPEINLEGETLAANLKLTVPANVPLGDYQIFVHGEMEIAWPRNPQALTRSEQRLERLKQQLTAAQDSRDKESGAEEIEIETLKQQIANAETTVNQLRESTKPQTTRAFLPSNPVKVRVLPAQ